MANLIYVIIGGVLVLIGVLVGAKMTNPNIDFSLKGIITPTKHKAVALSDEDEYKIEQAEKKTDGE